MIIHARGEKQLQLSGKRIIKFDKTLLEELDQDEYIDIVGVINIHDEEITIIETLTDVYDLAECEIDSIKINYAPSIDEPGYCRIVPAERMAYIVREDHIKVFRDCLDLYVAFNYFFKGGNIKIKTPVGKTKFKFTNESITTYGKPGVHSMTLSGKGQGFMYYAKGDTIFIITDSNDDSKILCIMAG